MFLPLKWFFRCDKLLQPRSALASWIQFTDSYGMHATWNSKSIGNIIGPMAAVELILNKNATWEGLEVIRMVQPAFQSLWTLPCWGSALVSALSKPGESPCWESVKENTEKTCKIKIDTCDMWETFSCVLLPAWNVRVYSLHFHIFWWSWDNFAVCIRS